MDLSWASLPPASDPALAEWLEGASCGPHAKALAMRAAHAAGQDVSADRWRHDVLSLDGLDLPAGAPAPAGQ